MAVTGQSYWPGVGISTVRLWAVFHGHQQHISNESHPAGNCGTSFPAIADMLDAAQPDLSAFATMPREHWHKIWSNNPIERLNREIKRHADVVQIFPNRESVTRLIGAVLQEQHEEWKYGERRYLSGD
ncbi:hypothetical protein GCM10009691_21310 [Brevibacterium picturae]|uniref:Mutator family transposase n=1 Tax=Brevibacterium picturae TaxID=260553 RepID=A0ABN2BUS4_9MICO